MKRKLLLIIGILVIILIVGSGNKDIAESNQTNETIELSNKETPETRQSINFDGYRILEVDGGDLSGDRQPNVAVDIGFGSRSYWAFTNEYGQLVRVLADEIILQDEDNEPTTNGRYYSGQAKVPGVELSNYDGGHVIADSLAELPTPII